MRGLLLVHLASLWLGASAAYGGSASLAASVLTSGTVNVAQLPALSTALVTTGTFNLSTLPSLAANALTSGTLNVAQVPLLTGVYVAFAGSTMTVR